MGNNMCPSATIIGEKNTYSVDNHYNFVENDKIEEGTLINVKNTSLDPYDYHVGKNNVDSFKNLEQSLTHIC